MAVLGFIPLSDPSPVITSRTRRVLQISTRTWQPQALRSRILQNSHTIRALANPIPQISTSAAANTTTPFPAKLREVFKSVPVFLWFIPLLIITAVVIGTLERKENTIKQFQTKLMELPSVDHLESIKLFGIKNGYKRETSLDAEILNIQGKQVSLKIFNALLDKHKVINKEAAKRGLEYYGFYTNEARQKPGSHPTIDLLIKVADDEKASLVVIAERIRKQGY